MLPHTLSFLPHHLLILSLLSTLNWALNPESQGWFCLSFSVLCFSSFYPTEEWDHLVFTFTLCSILHTPSRLQQKTRFQCLTDRKAGSVLALHRADLGFIYSNVQSPLNPIRRVFLSIESGVSKPWAQLGVYLLLHNKAKPTAFMCVSAFIRVK